MNKVVLFDNDDEFENIRTQNKSFSLNPKHSKVKSGLSPFYTVGIANY